MPFDATPQTDLDELCKHDEVLRVLVDADRRLSGPEKWCQGDPSGSSNKYCVRTALQCASHEMGGWTFNKPTFLMAQKALGFSSLDDEQVFRWNDAPERTFSDVKALFAKAISERTRAIRARQELVNA